MKNMVWKIKELESIDCYMLRNDPSDVTIYYDKIEIDQFGNSYELFIGREMVAMLFIKTNRIENFLDFHAPDKVRGESSVERGQARAGSGGESDST